LCQNRVRLAPNGGNFWIFKICFVLYRPNLTQFSSNSDTPAILCRPRHIIDRGCQPCLSLPRFTTNKDFRFGARAYYKKSCLKFPGVCPFILTLNILAQIWHPWPLMVKIRQLYILFTYRPVRFCFFSLEDTKYTEEKWFLKKSQICLIWSHL